MSEPDVPTREALDARRDPVLVEFGSTSCGYCRAAQPLIAAGLSAHPRVSHVKVEDGPGRALGRSFRVKLWPTLIFMAGGTEVTRLVRPQEGPAIEQALALIEAAP